MLLDQVSTIVLNGIQFDLKNIGRVSVDSGSIIRFFGILKEQQIPHLLVGGVAMLAYIEGRNTQDIDFLINPDDIERIPGLEVNHLNKDFGRGHFNGLQIDFLLTSNPLFKYAIDHYNSTVDVCGEEVACIQPEGLILLKLYAIPSLFRQGQYQRETLYEGDILNLLIQFPELDHRLEALIKRLRSHLIASDIEELQQIISEIRQRLRRSRR